MGFLNGLTPFYMPAHNTNIPKQPSDGIKPFPLHQKIVHVNRLNLNQSFHSLVRPIGF